MPDVYAWPPVFLSASEHTISRPVQRAEGLSGAPYLSQSEPTRALVTAVVSGIGRNRDQGAYVEALKVLLDGKLALVRMTPFKKHWWGGTGDLDGLRGGTPLSWTDDSNDLSWETGGAGLLWLVGRPITATAGNDGWPYIDCVGFPPNLRIAVPAEPVTGGGEKAIVLRTVTSDADGNARIYVSAPIPSGLVSIGKIESRVFEIPNFPRSIQSTTGNYSYSFDMVERFDTDFVDGFEELNPWS
ncbi:MAG: hypothetical protein WA790_15860 [Sulfitobacter sp.]